MSFSCILSTESTKGLDKAPVRSLQEADLSYGLQKPVNPPEDPEGSGAEGFMWPKPAEQCFA